MKAQDYVALQSIEDIDEEELSKEITQKIALLLQKFQENRLSIKKTTQELGALNAIIQGKP